MDKEPEAQGPGAALLPWWRVAVYLAATLGVFAALLFGPAGRLDWIAGWLYLAVMAASLILTTVYLQRVNPALIAYRVRMGMGEGTKGWDKLWAALFGPLFAAIYVVAALDAGRGGQAGMTDLMAGWWPAVFAFGLAVFAAGSWLIAWAMGVNPFFEKTVRIQKERGHRVIDTGPYRLMRHPGYVGFFGWTLAAPLMLGSWWALVPTVPALAAIIVRTALEDRTLRRELPGYEDYAARVRWRLIPGLW